MPSRSSRTGVRSDQTLVICTLDLEFDGNSARFWVLSRLVLASINLFRRLQDVYNSRSQQLDCGS
jgi:hypothetical protein